MSKIILPDHDVDKMQDTFTTSVNSELDDSVLPKNHQHEDSLSWSGTYGSCEWSALHQPNTCLSSSNNNDDDDDLATVPLVSFGEVSHKRSCGLLCCEFIRSITVEPCVLMITFTLFLQMVVQKNLIIAKLCLVEFGLNESACTNSSNATMEKHLQMQTTTIEMYISFVETFPSIVFSIFLGAYSDHHSRKLPMIIPLLGNAMSSALLGIAAYFLEEFPPELLPLCSIPKALCGGIIGALVVCLSYVSDRTSSDKRTVRLAMVEAAFLIGQPLGTLAGGYIAKISYVLIFVIGFSMFIITIVYIVVVIRDTNPPKRSGPSNFCKDFFNITSYKDTMACFFKWREGNARFRIFMLLGVTTFLLLPSIGQSSINYLYVRLKFNWDLLTYSYFSAMSSISTSLGLLLCTVIFVRMLKFHDMVLAILGVFGAVSVSLLYAFITDAVLLYFICVPLLLCGTTQLSVRSQISKMVPRDEQGKVLSVLASFEAVVPLIASVVYTQVYNATVVTFPEMVYLMSAGIYGIPLVLTCIVIADLQRRHGYTPVPPDEK